MKAQRPFGIGRGARLLKKYDHERLLRASWEVLGSPRRSQEVPRVPGRHWGLHTRHLGTDGLRPKPHVSADASVPMPAFSTLAELARYRARPPIARAMEDAAIQIAVNGRISVPKKKPSACTNSCRTLLAIEAKRQYRIHSTAVTSLEMRKEESPCDFGLGR